MSRASVARHWLYAKKKKHRLEAEASNLCGCGYFGDLPADTNVFSKM